MPTVIVEDGTGVVGANSFGSVAELRTFGLDRGVDLSALTDDTVGTLLIKATDWVEGQEYDFVGDRTFTTQELSWPRSTTCPAVDLGVPKNVKFAQFAAALAVHSGVDLFPVVDGGLIPSEEGVGPIKVKYSRTGMYSGPSIPAADNYLKPYLKRYVGLQLKVIRV